MKKMNNMNQIKTDENEEAYTGGILSVYRKKVAIIAFFAGIGIDLIIAITWLPIELSEDTIFQSVQPFVITMILVILIPVVLAFIWGHYYARNFEYVLDKKFIKINYGVLSRNRTTIPFSRIQNIAVKQSLLDRMLNIYTVAIETAGGQSNAQKGIIKPEGYIPALKDPTKLESLIDELVHEYTQDVPEKVRSKVFLDKDVAFDEFIAYILTKLTEGGEMKTKIRELREKKKWTQAELAEHIGVSRQTISYLETGRYMPSLKIAFKIARLFEVQIEEIFEMDEEE